MVGTISLSHKYTSGLPAALRVFHRISIYVDGYGWACHLPVGIHYQPLTEDRHHSLDYSTRDETKGERNYATAQ
jgi:hypothetical protein